METRKLQRTGGSSLILSLPKKWIKQNGLRDKDLIKIYISGPHSLILRPFNKHKKTLKSILDINGLTNNMLTREMIAHFVSGVDEIVVRSNRITPDKRNAIRWMSNYLIGFEIIDESAEKIILRNIFDPAKFPISKNIEKMFFTTISMFKDSLSALINDDKTLAKDVIERDFEIDKLDLMTKRQRHSMSLNIISEEDTGLSLDDLHYYEYVATQLERIADHAVKIARIVNTIDKKFDKVIDMDQFKIVTDKINMRLEEANNMVKNLDKIAAHKILDENTEIEKTGLNNIGSKKGNSFVTNLIEDSFDRVLRYTMNIAEITIDQSVARENR